MIDALHLLWIVPASVMLGYVLSALLTANKQGENG